MPSGLSESLFNPARRTWQPPTVTTVIMNIIIVIAEFRMLLQCYQLKSSSIKKKGQFVIFYHMVGFYILLTVC